MTYRHGGSWQRVALWAVVYGLLFPQAGLAAPGSTTVVEGTIAEIDAGAVTVATGTDGQARAAVTGDTLVLQRKSVTLVDIKPADFVAVTARREADGSLTALSINIFPPQFRGRVREAQFVMETGNIMTNATVFQNVGRIEGRTLYLKLSEGSVIIAVPKEAQVFRLTVIKLTDLKPGLHAVVRETTGADGTSVAVSITVDSQ